MSEGNAAHVIEEIFRREAGRVLATLIRLLGDFDLAEEAQQEAFATALEQWPSHGTPANPRAWLISTGRNKAIDRIRRDIVFRTKISGEIGAAGSDVAAAPDAADEEVFGDDRLRLIFTCCHPALSEEAQIALTLREVCGLSTQAVARAFLISEETMAQRLVRAKKKIRDAGIPYETPEPSVLEQRIEGVLAVIYGVFTEGYAATVGAQLIDVELCEEAIRLGRLLDAAAAGARGRDGPAGADALARCATRIADFGQRRSGIARDQDRSQWNRNEISEGLLLVDRSLSIRGQVSAYAVQAAIAALHVRAEESSATDWPQIVGLYEVLLRLQPTPVIELNHAVAVSMVDGPARALDLIDSLAARGRVTQYHLLHAARGRLLQKLGRINEAREAYSAALITTMLDPERRFLAARIAAIQGICEAPVSG